MTSSPWRGVGYTPALEIMMEYSLSPHMAAWLWFVHIPGRIIIDFATLSSWIDTISDPIPYHLRMLSKICSLVFIVLGFLLGYYLFLFLLQRYDFFPIYANIFICYTTYIHIYICVLLVAPSLGGAGGTPPDPQSRSACGAPALGVFFAFFVIQKLRLSLNFVKSCVKFPTPSLRTFVKKC